jgi:hypothetical protein
MTEWALVADASGQRTVQVAASPAVGLALLDQTAVVTALRAIPAELGTSSPALQCRCGTRTRRWSCRSDAATGLWASVKDRIDTL